MIAFEIRQPGDFGLIETAPPRAGMGEVIVRVAACGICGSDLDMLEGRRPDSVTRYPVIPGHEFCGEIVEVGDGVSPSRIGERVVVDAMVAPATCDNCRKGWVCHCRHGYDQLGFTRPGGMAELVVLNESQAWPMRDDLSWEAGALVEPASCAAHGVEKAGLEPGATVVVVGAGPIGALAIQIAAMNNPARIILVETDPLKLGRFQNFGATDAINARTEPVAESIMDLTDGRGADAVIECAGSMKAIQESFRYAGTKARIVLVGIPGVTSFEVDYLAMLTNDLTLSVSNGYTTDVWRRTMELLGRGRIDIRPIISHKKPLQMAPQAFDILRKRSGTVTKMLLVPGLKNEVTGS